MTLIYELDLDMHTKNELGQTFKRHDTQTEATEHITVPHLWTATSRTLIEAAHINANQ